MLHKLKKFLIPLHLYLGLITGVVVFLVSITGSIYLFEGEMREAMYADLRKAHPVEGGNIQLSNIIAKIDSVYPQREIKLIIFKDKEDQNFEVIFKKKESVYIDPYSLKIYDASAKGNDFLTTILRIHRQLYMGAWGKRIVGGCTLIFVFMLISGLILWWPSHQRSIKKKFIPFSKFGYFKKVYDLHSVLGFYASWIALIIAITGLLWSFKWVSNGAKFVLNPKSAKQVRVYSDTTHDYNPKAIDVVWRQMESQVKLSERTFLTFPKKPLSTFQARFRSGKNSFFTKQDVCHYDQYSGQLLQQNKFESGNLGFKILSSQRDLHTGDSLGIVGKYLWLLVSLICASLPITGFLMWYEKRKMKRK